MLLLAVAAGAAAWGPAWTRVPRPDAEQESLFPYQALIERQARAFRVDPYLVAAVIDNESGFDPRKRSPDGAIGLMQVMPDTGRLAAAALDIDPFRPDDLYDPEVDVRIGCWYLARLIETYDGDLVAALAAYNVGPGTLEAWRRLPRWRTHQGVDRIPLLETRSYVHLVLRERDVYRRRARED